MCNEVIPDDAFYVLGPSNFFIPDAPRKVHVAWTHRRRRGIANVLACGAPASTIDFDRGGPPLDASRPPTCMNCLGKFNEWREGNGLPPTRNTFEWSEEDFPTRED